MQGQKSKVAADAPTHLPATPFVDIASRDRHKHSILPTTDNATT